MRTLVAEDDDGVGVLRVHPQPVRGKVAVGRRQTLAVHRLEACFFFNPPADK